MNTLHNVVLLVNTLHNVVLLVNTLDKLFHTKLMSAIIHAAASKVSKLTDAVLVIKTLN